MPFGVNVGGLWSWAMNSGLVTGVGFLLLLAVVGRFAVGLANSNGNADRAARRTWRWGVAILGGIFGLIASGVYTVGQFADQAAELVGLAPWVLGELVAIVTGFLGLSGAIRMTPELFLGVTLGTLGVALLSREAS